MNVRERINKFTDITVDWNPVDHVPVPYDRVDALHQASETGPDHIQASARIPGWGRIFLEWGTRITLRRPTHL